MSYLTWLVNESPEAYFQPRPRKVSSTSTLILTLFYFLSLTIIIMSPAEGEGVMLFLVWILLASVLALACHFLVCTISHEPVSGF